MKITAITWSELVADEAEELWAERDKRRARHADIGKIGREYSSPDNSKKNKRRRVKVLGL